MCERIGIFSGRTAWFSKSVPVEVKNLWIKRGGLVRGCLSAQYLFSDDPNAKDTIGFYRSLQHQNSRLIIFTSQWIEDAVENGRLCEIAYAHYILGGPSKKASADADFKKWNFVDESKLKIRSLKDFRQSQATHKCPQGSVFKKPTEVYEGFLHIDDIHLTGPATDLRDFVPNCNGFKVKLA